MCSLRARYEEGVLNELRIGYGALTGFDAACGLEVLVNWLGGGVYG